MVKTCLGTVLGILIAFGLMFGGCAYLAGLFIKEAAKNQNGGAKHKEPAERLTMGKYNAIQSGMSYAEVVKIVGFDGEESASSNVEGIPGFVPSVDTKLFSWNNSNGSNMIVTFQNNKLVGKAQFGLK